MLRRFASRSLLFRYAVLPLFSQFLSIAYRIEKRNPLLLFVHFSPCLFPALWYTDGRILRKEGHFVEKLSRSDHIDLYRHLAFSAVGGFFGCHAVLVHGGIMGNAQTVNLLELLLDALRGDAYATALHLGALALYVLGTMLTVLLPH